MGSGTPEKSRQERVRAVLAPPGERASCSGPGSKSESLKPGTDHRTSQLQNQENPLSGGLEITWTKKWELPNSTLKIGSFIKMAPSGSYITMVTLPTALPLGNSAFFQGKLPRPGNSNESSHS